MLVKFNTDKDHLNLQIQLGEGVGPHAAVGGATVGFEQHPCNV